MASLKYYISIYLRQMKKLKAEHPRQVKFYDMARFFPKWMKSFYRGYEPIAKEEPWLTFNAIEFLTCIIKKDMVVFEYGTGGSTLFFARKVREVFSVEHNRLWYERVLDKLKDSNYKNCHIELQEPVHDPFNINRNPGAPDSYTSSNEEYHGKCFKNYVMYIENFPDSYFDLILIDGRARPSCFKHAVKKVKHGGFIILDDAQRGHYSHINNFTDDTWRCYSFYGLGAGVQQYKQTCFWKKET